MSEPSSSAAPVAPPPAPVAPIPAGHPAPPVFSIPAFAAVAVAVVGAIRLGMVAQAAGERFGAGAGQAAAIAAAALVAGLGGALAAWVGRRLAFYEISAVGLLWLLGVAAVVVRPDLLERPFLAGLAPLFEGLRTQGTLVVVLGGGGAGVLATVAAMGGSSLTYLLTGTGRLDLSVSYEAFVARSHLRLTPVTLAALFGLVVTGLVPGLLVALVWSFVRDVQERHAYRRGELTHRPRMPATLLMTLISIAGVALGVWALTVVLSVMSGFEADLKKKILGQTAHGLVLAYGQDEFGDWQDARRKALSVPGVVGATPFLYNEVMLTTGQNLAGAMVRGIDPATVGTVTELPRSLQAGELRWLAHPDQIPASRLPGGLGEGRGEDAGARRSGGRALPGLVLGRELASSLRVEVGDLVNVVSPMGDLGPAGPQPKSRAFRVAAIFYSGMYEYDSKFAYIDLAEAQRFFAAESVTGLEVKVRDVDDAPRLMKSVVRALGGVPYYAKDWGELNRNLFAALQMEKVVMAVILGFIVVVASFIIVATLIMQVLEKRKEIAVLKSMGAGVPSVMKIFVAEGVVIGAVGTIFGLILGYGTCLIIDKVGIPLNPEVYYISNLPVVIEGGQFLRVALAALTLSYFATLYPATKAARLHPVDGLRSE